jgi:predicted 2-oxoglutarate/Fe(II)-dependent dioxygenase YbiX
MRANFAESLLDAVNQINRPGSYCTKGVAPAVVPGLAVDGVGAIGLPLSSQQAEQLKTVCVQAPYGKGEKTVLDTSVRKVWKLTSEHFNLENPDWRRALDEIVQSVQRDLGLTDQKLQAHLYDLLLYEPGGFFLPHQDGERIDRMVATLVVVLPSNYAGGELIVRHEGDETTIDFATAKDPRFATHYAAFYADCEHEVRPLTRGHRLCLVYNLTIKSSADVVGAPQKGMHVERIAHLLRAWPNGKNDPTKLAIALEHEYTQDGLRWATLKGIDRARGAVLAEAAAQAGCHVNLALLTYWESGSADEGAYYGRSRRSHSWRVHEEGEDASNAKMGELYDSSLTAENWRAPGDVEQQFGSLPLKEDEILPQGAIKRVKPKSEIDGYLGNEGLTLNRWYRRAAFVLWPEERHFDVMVSQGAAAAVPALEQMAQSVSARKGNSAEEQRDRCRRFAESVLDAWPEREDEYFGWRPRESKRKVADPIAALDMIDDVELMQTYVAKVLPRDISLQPANTLARIVKRHGIAPFAASLADLFKRANSASLARDAAILERVANAASSSNEAPEAMEARRVLGPALESAVQTLIARDSKPRDRYFAQDDVTTASILTNLARSVLLLRFKEILQKLVMHVVSQPKLYSLQAVQMVALEAICDKWRRGATPALSRWIEHVGSELESLTRQIPRPPSDYARGADLGCDCGDCKQLKRFLLDPTAQECGFKMAEHRRRHLSETIRQGHCDLDCRTERRSNPHVLVCTKNQATYERLLAEYHQNLKHLQTLRAMHTSVSVEKG